MVYELDVWSRDLNIVFTLKDYLFGAVKLAKNADPEKYSHSGCGIGFGCCSLFFNHKLLGQKCQYTKSI